MSTFVFKTQTHGEEQSLSMKLKQLLNTKAWLFVEESFLLRSTAPL